MKHPCLMLLSIREMILVFIRIYYATGMVVLFRPLRKNYYR